MLLNHSNHPHATWSSAQAQAAANQFGQTTDLPFPEIDPTWEYRQVEAKAAETIAQITAQYPGEVAAQSLHILVAGEQSYLLAFHRLASQTGLHLYAATSHRISTLLEDGSKKVTFEFCQFRKIH